MDTASVVFTLDELWLLRSVVRHEMQGQEMWKFPPAGLLLNGQIAEAILFCHENDQDEAALTLTQGDCLIFDYLVPQDAKNARGIPLGVPVLLKTFGARRDIARGVDVEACCEEAPIPPPEVISDALQRADRLEQQRARRAARRKAKE